jgi:hypothetical protein
VVAETIAASGFGGIFSITIRKELPRHNNNKNNTATKDESKEVMSHDQTMKRAREDK